MQGDENEGRGWDDGLLAANSKIPVTADDDDGAEEIKEG